MNKINILLIGSGGRESALAQIISQSNICEHLFIAPGNPNTAVIGTNVPIEETDFKNLAIFCLQKNIIYIVVGPELPLTKGIRDFFETKRLDHIKIIGPTAIAAQLEGSKAFAKSFMMRHKIPTASYREFTKEQLGDAQNYIDSHALPIVLKADGLASGKGVIICQTKEEAIQELKAMFLGKFGEAGNTVVIEEFLHGVEVSILIATDGNNFVVLPPARDYKRVGDNDTGLNTGGMGAISHDGLVTKEFMDSVKKTIIIPTIRGMQDEDLLYKGFLYFGLMDVSGNPYVIEYNCRLGDPETQVILPRIMSDFGEIIIGVSEGSLDKVQLQITPLASVGVVLAAKGYPEQYTSGLPFSVETQIAEYSFTHNVFLSGVVKKDNSLITAGGRVALVQGLGIDLQEARHNCYKIVKHVLFSNKYFRKDIGK